MLGAVGLGRLDILLYIVHAFSVAHSGTAVKGFVIVSFSGHDLLFVIDFTTKLLGSFHAPPLGAAGVGACVGSSLAPSAVCCMTDQR